MPSEVFLASVHFVSIWKFIPLSFDNNSNNYYHQLIILAWQRTWHVTTAAITATVAKWRDRHKAPKDNKKSVFTESEITSS